MSFAIYYLNEKRMRPRTRQEIRPSPHLAEPALCQLHLDGGKCLNKLARFLARLFAFLSVWPLRSALSVPRQINCFDCESKTSTTTVPTLVTSVVVVAMPIPPPPRHRQPPP